MFGNIVERIENVIVQVGEVKVQFVEKDAKIEELEGALAAKEAEALALKAQLEEMQNKVVSEEDMANLLDAVGRLENAFIEPIE